MSIVIGGAAAYFWVLTVAWVLAGQPALTATALAWACSLAFVPWAAVVVLVTGDLEATVGPLLETRKAMPTIAPAATSTMITLRSCRRCFFCLASAASRASLAARWRALLSLGTGADPTQSREWVSDRPVPVGTAGSNRGRHPDRPAGMEPA